MATEITLTISDAQLAKLDAIQAAEADRAPGLPTLTRDQYVQGIVDAYVIENTQFADLYARTH